MKIAEVKKLDDGVSGIVIEGRITRVLKPRESQYGWSQFVVIKDDTDNMGSNINIENEEAKYQGGEFIQVKGKVSHYVKGGKPNVSLNGNVIDEIVQTNEDVSQEQPQDNTKPMEKTREKTVEKEYTKDDYWRDKALRDIENNKCIVRECAIKAVTELAKVKQGDGFLISINTEKEYFDFADKIENYIIGLFEKLTSEAITKEFGGTVKELEKEMKGADNLPPTEVKEQKIAQARELVRNPHLAEPVNDKMATVPQKKQIYGYINEEGKKIGGIVDSQYIKKGEVKKIGKAQDLTKANAIRYWEFWYGKEGELGERDKRELSAKEKEKEGNPFITERDPVEKRDPKDDTSLAKDLLIEKIQALRKKYVLEDDAKFTGAFGCNAKFELWTEKELIKLKEKLEMYKPNWVTENAK